MHSTTLRTIAWKRGTVALAIACIVGIPGVIRATDDFEKIQAEAGRQWYDHYCTRCHGAGGAPGSAVYPDSKKPVDLRNYVARNGGTFPAARWISVVTTENPSLVHTAVWHKIRDAQVGGVSSDATARGVVASIASYIRSIQQ